MEIPVIRKQNKNKLVEKLDFLTKIWYNFKVNRLCFREVN